MVACDAVPNHGAMDRASAIDAVLTELAGGEYDVHYVATSHGVLEIQILVWSDGWVEVPSSPFTVSISAGVQQQWPEAAAALKRLLNYTPVIPTRASSPLMRQHPSGWVDNYSTCRLGAGT
jgi:hypothetical protein